ncbi:dNTP triphosphohydrolase [Bacillus sp. NTK071]|nr:dNTP triphosphohydrolase [Bacillus sp. NTK071]
MENVRIYDESKVRDRNPSQRDYSRVLYSPSFRRLQGKMQLLGVQSDQFYRNRLTHSLEVAQIARSIAEKLRRDSGLNDVFIDDIYIVEAGSLAHDIGNPPFGHHGERVLNELMRDKGGFEGNAQTVRVLQNLEKKLPKSRGLNLTLRTLFSVVKYYVPYNYEGDSKIKKFIYQSTFDRLQKQIENKSIEPRTIDVQIVDIADEIAYAAHDLEDALSLKLFNIDEFIFELKQGNNIHTLNEFERIVEKAKEFAFSADNYHSSEEFGLLFRKEVTSNLVDILIKDIGLVEVDEIFKKETGTSHSKEVGFCNLKDLAKGLKDKTFECINRSNIVQVYEKQGEKVIKGLFTAFNDEKFNKGNLLLPVEYRMFDEEEESRERVIADYISGMMDSFAINTFTKLFGSNSLEKLYDKEYFGDYNNHMSDK